MAAFVHCHSIHGLLYGWTLAMKVLLLIGVAFCDLAKDLGYVNVDLNVTYQLAIAVTLHRMNLDNDRLMLPSNHIYHHPDHPGKLSEAKDLRRLTNRLRLDFRCKLFLLRILEKIYILLNREKVPEYK